MQVVLIAALVGCRAPSPMPPPGVAWQNAWYCEEAADDDGWACARNAEPAATRREPVIATPSPPPAPPAAHPQPPPRGEPAPVQAPPPVAPPQVAKPAPAAPPPAPTPPAAARPPAAEPPAAAEPPHPAMPLYRRLAYPAPADAALADFADGLFVVQLVALSSRQRLVRFVAEHRLHDMTAVRIEHDGRPLHVLLAGVFGDRETAQRAAASLPAGELGVRPWVRPLETLRQAMRRADRTFGAR